jgi:hypothetical protein
MKESIYDDIARYYPDHIPGVFAGTLKRLETALAEMRADVEGAASTAEAKRITVAGMAVFARALGDAVTDLVVESVPDAKPAQVVALMESIGGFARRRFESLADLRKVNDLLVKGGEPALTDEERRTLAAGGLDGLPYDRQVTVARLVAGADPDNAHLILEHTCDDPHCPLEAVRRELELRAQREANARTGNRTDA